MVDKLFRTMTTMAEAPERIEDIVESEQEYYFRFKEHVFSIAKRSERFEAGRFWFYVYPVWTQSLETLAASFDEGTDVKLAAYQSGENEEPFARLYAVVRSVYLNVDDIFDDILGESEDEQT